MPITKSATKALRVSNRKKVANDKRKKDFKEAIKKVEKLMASGKKNEAIKLISSVYKAIDKASKIGVLNKNTASRKKSRIARMMK